MEITYNLSYLIKIAVQDLQEVPGIPSVKGSENFNLAGTITSPEKLEDKPCLGGRLTVVNGAVFLKATVIFTFIDKHSVIEYFRTLELAQHRAKEVIEYAFKNGTFVASNS